MADDTTQGTLPSDDIDNMDDKTMQGDQTGTQSQDLNPLGEKGGKAQQEDTDMETDDTDLTDTKNEEGGDL